jgi:NAD(P)H-quinone oxidoreductase subunit M
VSDTPLKCTTRHVRIFAATVAADGNLEASADKLTLDLDPDSEFEWDAASLEQVQERFRQLVNAAAGSKMTDYNLRRIGSELEGTIRQLLQAGNLRYNLNSRVLNYSMGLPRSPETL